MTCPVCGFAPCPLDSRFCPRCGASLPGPAASGPAAGPAPPPPIFPAPVAPAAAGPGQALPAGSLLHGQYRIERVLGMGAFGRVYLAHDEQAPGNPVLAIKELLVTQFPTAAERHEAMSWFKREVGTLLTLEHPGIPALYGYWSVHPATGPLYLSMEYIPGKTLEEILRETAGPLPWPRVTAWGVTLCEVLAYLHSRTPPFVFRDMKPANVILDERIQRPVLIDFGITRQLVAAGGTAIGTWGFVPPEQAEGRAEPRSDLYALGATLYALLTGRSPDAEYLRLMRQGMAVRDAMQALFPPLDPVTSGVPPALVAALARATAYDKDSRFADAQAMAAALRDALAPRAAPAVVGTVAVAPGVVSGQMNAPPQVTSGLAIAPAPTPGPAAASRRPNQRRRAIALGAAAAGFIAVSGARRPPPPRRRRAWRRCVPLSVLQRRSPPHRPPRAPRIRPWRQIRRRRPLRRMRCNPVSLARMLP